MGPARVLVVFAAACGEHQAGRSRHRKDLVRREGHVP